MNENLLNISIISGCFQEAIRNGTKNTRFCLRKLYLSPRVSSLDQLKEKDDTYSNNHWNGKERGWLLKKIPTKIALISSVLELFLAKVSLN